MRLMAPCSRQVFLGAVLLTYSLLGCVSRASWLVLASVVTCSLHSSSCGFSAASPTHISLGGDRTRWQAAYSVRSLYALLFVDRYISGWAVTTERYRVCCRVEHLSAAGTSPLIVVSCSRDALSAVPVA